MPLKPINRQGKTRRKLKTLPSLSCGYAGFTFAPPKDIELPKSPEAQSTKKKDKAAA